MSTLDMVQASIDAIRANERDLQEIRQTQRLQNEKIQAIEAKTQTRPEYWTVVGYASSLGIKVNLKQASSFGRKASILAKAKGLPLDEIPDPRFGRVNMYPESVLKEVFDSPVN
jgi:anti-repressor protein